jgi:hypothetical protein
VFIVLCCMVAWLPLAITIAGLHLRASQIVLPLVLMLLWVQRPFTRPSRLELLIGASAAIWWAATLWWTVASGSGIGPPLARVFLHALNLLQFTAIYLLVQRSRKLHSSTRTFLATVAFLNAFVLTASSLASLGFELPQEFLAEEAAPLAVEGEVVSGSVRRFSVGVVVGCVSAAAFVLALSLLLDPAERRKTALLFSAAFAGVGIIIGFSRQGVLSLLAGLAVVVLGSLQWRHIRRLFKAAALTVLLLLAVVGLLALLPGGQDYLQAFAGRTLLLVQPDAYSTGTVLGRTSMWLDMLADIRANPLVGRGQDAYRQYGNAWEEGSHNFPLEVLHTAGVWGFVPFLVFHAAIPLVALGLARRARRAGRPPFLLLGLLGAYVAVTFASLTNLIFWGPVYWVVAALLAAATSVPDEGTSVFPALSSSTAGAVGDG